MLFRSDAHDWIDVFETVDNGDNWQRLSRPVPSTGGHGGNPPSMVRLKDGRISVTYGYRAKPYGIRARLSEDEGKTWGKEILLRQDSATWEVGYTRTVQRPDGKMVTVYYFAEDPAKERIIAATIWDAGVRTAPYTHQVGGGGARLKGGGGARLKGGDSSAQGNALGIPLPHYPQP